MNNERKIIYLVEDPLLGQLMGAYLLSIFRGKIQVEKFSSFETAVERFDSSNPRPGVVYGAMLQAKGLPLCARMKVVDPTVRFILASGSPPEGINEQLLEAGVLPDAVLHKPFSLEQLQVVIRELLAGAPKLPLGMSKSGVWPFYRLEGAWRARAYLPLPAIGNELPTHSKTAE